MKNIILIFIMLFLTNCYTQDQELFDHTWFLEKVVVENTDHFPPHQNFTTELYIYSTGLHYTYINCNQGWGFENINFDSNVPIFSLPNGPIFIGDECTNTSYLTFIGLHNDIYFLNNSIAQNPFTYTIASVNNYKQLIIENGEGDRAFYNSVLMSTSNFSQNTFAIYPNPVKETIHIDHVSHQDVQAHIYDINGKLVQTQILETGNSTFSVKSLNIGLYFIVFESESGERVTEKFVKE